MARPAIYSQEIADRICELIATTSDSLVSICKSNDLPSIRTVQYWLANPDYIEFLHNYTRAREEQADLLADEIIEIADDSSGDTTIDAEGNVRMNSEFAARSKIRVDARKWKASKLAPKKYSEKIQTELSGSIKTESDLDLSQYTDEELAMLIELQSKGRAGKA